MNQPRAEPRYFGPGERPCFGWLHHPAAGAAAPRLGLVICNPFGQEAVSSHRSVRAMAEAAAAAGVPTLRFDYEGTGDSAGDDRDPGRWDAWLASVHHAVEELRRGSGVERVCLLGVRIGATLATLAAAARDDVAGLAAIVPVVAGKAWLRELKVLETMIGFAPAPAGYEVDPDIQEAAGFALTAPTREAASRVNLRALDRAPAADVLILDRADLPLDTGWADHLRALGARVEHRQAAGYTEMMLDSHETVVPAAMIAAVSAWLEQRAAASAPRAAAGFVPPAGAPSATIAGVEETAVFLDDDRIMFGIVSAPAGVPRPTRAIVLPNSGAIQRTGPSRQYVRLARRWAARGYLVLRFDQSGIGDSLPRPGERENVVYSPRAVEDVTAAVAFLRDRWGVTSCRAMGLCSGAYHAFKAAVAGVPLERVAIVNPLVFFWKEGMSLAYPTYQVAEATARYKRNLLRPDKWKKLLSGQVDLGAFVQVAWRRAAIRAGAALRDAARLVGHPLPDDLGAELEAVASRGVALQFVFASGDPGEDLLRVEAGSSLRRLLRDRQLRIQRIDGPNHAFTPLWSQAALGVALDDALDVR